MITLFIVGQISTCLARANLNIEDLLNKSYGELAYTIVDLDGSSIDVFNGLCV